MEEIKNYCVYMHTTPNKKVYIGITCQKPERRWSNGNHYKGQYFYRAIQKYGWENIEHTIIAEHLTEKEAKKMEIELIAKYDSTDKNKGYNITIGGDYSAQLGKPRTEEEKQKISSTMKGYKQSEEHIKHKAEVHKGFKMSDEAKQKISIAKKGQTAWNKGKKMEGDYLKNYRAARCKPVLVYLNPSMEFYMRFESRKECAEYFGVSDTTVGDCLAGRTQTFKKKKYIAKYE